MPPSDDPPTPTSARTLTDVTSAGSTPRPPSDDVPSLDPYRGSDTRGDPDASRPANVVGRYTLLERIGEGGMGVVHKAYDPVLDRAVALKLLHAREGASPSTARLMREAQALARVNDRNVVVVYEVGTHHGAPYIAMELAEGGTLAQWLAAAPRTSREIVAAFVEAAHGLIAVHRAGLVHRDFKPSNVLVGRDGRFRVADFGIARSSGDRAHDDGTAARAVDVDLTRTGALVGTPAYMAPEQARGEAADASSDQFSFCMALYEALAGERPTIAVATAGAATNARGVVEPASGASITGWLRKALLRGLSPSRDARFPSMEALLHALVTDPARRVQRRRTLTAIGAAALGVAGVVGVSIVGASSRTVAPCENMGAPLVGVWDDAARHEVEQAMRASSRSYAPDTWSRVRASLDAYATSWTAARADACRATHVRNEQSEALLDLRMRCLDRRRVELLRLREVLAKTDDVTVDNATTAVGKLTDLATCADVAALSARKHRSGAAPRAEEASIEDDLARVKALHDAGKYKEAMAAVELLLAKARAFDDPGLLAETLHRKGLVHYVLDENDGAIATFTESELQGDAASDDHLRFASTIGLIDITGYALRDEKQTNALEQRARMLVKRMGDEPALVAELDESLSYSDTAFAHLDKARAHAEENLAIKRKIAGASSLPYAKALRALGRVAQHQMRVDEAIALFEPALAIAERELGPFHPQLLHYTHSLGNAYEARGDLARAVPLLRRDLALCEAAERTDSAKVGVALESLSSALHLLGENDEALATATRAQPILAATFGPNSVFAGGATYKIALAQRGLHHLDAAEEAARAALASYAKTTDPGRAPAEEPLNLLAEIAAERGDVAQALKLVAEAIARVPSPPGDDAPRLIDPLLTRARLLLRTGRADAALADATRAREILAQWPQAPDDDARALFVAAQAVSARDAAQAKDLAAQALAKLTPMGPHVEPLRAELRAFVAAR